MDSAPQAWLSLSLVPGVAPWAEIPPNGAGLQLKGKDCPTITAYAPDCVLCCGDCFFSHDMVDFSSTCDPGETSISFSKKILHSLFPCCIEQLMSPIRIHLNSAFFFSWELHSCLRNFILSLQSSADFDKIYCSMPGRYEAPGATTAKQIIVSLLIISFNSACWLYIIVCLGGRYAVVQFYE